MDGQNGMNGQPAVPTVPPQMVQVVYKGLKIQAPVDLWVAKLVEVLDEELLEKWVQRMKQHIEAQSMQQVKPVQRIIIPGRG
jgi:hypothetical protein